MSFFYGLKDNIGDLLWIRVIIMTIIYHCTVTTQVLVNRGFRMIECRINHITFSWAVSWWAEAEAENGTDIISICKPWWRMKCVRHLWFCCYHRDLWQSSKLILVSLSPPDPPFLLAISSCLFLSCFEMFKWKT